MTEDDHKHLHYHYDQLGQEVPSYINHDHTYHQQNNYDHSHNDHAHSDYLQNDYRYLDHESYELPNNDHYHEAHSFDDGEELANEHAQWNAYKTGTRTYFRPTPPTSFQQRAPESKASGKQTKKLWGQVKETKFPVSSHFYSSFSPFSSPCGANFLTLWSDH